MLPYNELLYHYIILLLYVLKCCVKGVTKIYTKLCYVLYGYDHAAMSLDEKMSCMYIIVDA